MIFYITIILGTTLDLFTKQLALIYLQDKINILGDIFYLKYALNPGIAFSIELPLVFLKILTIFLIIIIFYYHGSERKKINNSYIKKFDLSFGLILAGAIGNAIERVFNSNVIDFIGVKYFAIFNLADVFINLGAILYIYIIYKNKKSIS